jgi:hypothetical protein
VDNVQEGYIPQRQKEINQLRGEDDIDIDESEHEEEEVEQVKPAPKQKSNALV